MLLEAPTILLGILLAALDESLEGMAVTVLLLPFASLLIAPFAFGGAYLGSLVSPTRKTVTVKRKSQEGTRSIDRLKRSLACAFVWGATLGFAGFTAGFLVQRFSNRIQTLQDFLPSSSTARSVFSPASSWAAFYPG